MANIEDFGKKIGGAKKDLWAARGLSIEDLVDMNDAEREKYVNKDNIWKKPDYQEMVNNGTPIRVAYYIKLIRDGLPKSPEVSFGDMDNLEALQNRYVTFVNNIRDAAMTIKTDEDIQNFYKNYISPYLTKTGYYRVSINEDAKGCINNKFLKAAQSSSVKYLDAAIRKKQFLYSEDDKLLVGYDFIKFDDRCTYEIDKYSNKPRIAVKNGSSINYYYIDKNDDGKFEKDKWFAADCGNIVTKNVETMELLKENTLNSIKSNFIEKDKDDKQTTRKKKFVPEQLKHISFKGRDYRDNRTITGQDYLDEFKFYGGEFGNWLNDNDRQTSLNMAYEAFHALSEALGIKPDDISLGGKLSIAFGARGSAGAVAHYEPMREVINLTKMKGAGSLAHEWGHAMDDILNKELGNKDLTAVNRKLLDAQKKLQNDMKYKIVTKPNDVEKYKADYEKYKSWAKSWIVAPKDMTDKQEQKWNELTDAVLNGKDYALGTYSYIDDTNKQIEALSKYKKELTGKSISKTDKEKINVNMYHAIFAYEKMQDTSLKEVRVKTDYFKNSEKMDGLHSKEDKGYWSSDCEMFARAFACYIHDKLKEMGITCDYLVGHSELAVSFDADLNVVKAIPTGEEREVINKDFDDLIAAFKEKELLHQREVSTVFDKPLTTEEYVDYMINHPEISLTNNIPVSSPLSIKEFLDIDIARENLKGYVEIKDSKESARFDEVFASAKKEAEAHNKEHKKDEPSLSEQISLF